MDLDHFKKVNDVHGHGVGDGVLRAFANHVRTYVRRIDVLVRRGGEEFFLILPNTDLEQARATAERIRQTLAAGPLDTGRGVCLDQTVSVGVAMWDGAESPEELDHRADAAMYESKRTGRNRVTVAPEPVPMSGAHCKLPSVVPREDADGFSLAMEGESPAIEGSLALAREKHPKVRRLR
jgi:diguanylate cyclase (GGDEF)-like protein